MVILKDFLTPEEGIRHEETQTTLFISDKEVGKGTLYITDSLFSWVNNDTREGFSIEYSHITLHATCPETPQIPPCLYIMVDAKVNFPSDTPNPEPNNVRNNLNSSNEDDEDDDSEPIITEMKFVPTNKNNLDHMFKAMSECQALNPDPQDSYTDDDEIYQDAEEDEEYSDAENNVDMHSPDNGRNHNDTDETMDIEAGQFEDAEEDP